MDLATAINLTYNYSNLINCMTIKSQWSDTNHSTRTECWCGSATQIKRTNVYHKEHKVACLLHVYKWNSPNLVLAIPFFPSLALLVLLVVESVGEGCRFLTGTELGALPDGSHSSDKLWSLSSSVITRMLFRYAFTRRTICAWNST